MKIHERTAILSWLEFHYWRNKQETEFEIVCNTITLRDQIKEVLDRHGIDSTSKNGNLIIEL